MEGEFNNLDINNAKITFSTSTNNTATSDELSAPLMYQERMGTAYSRSKLISRSIVATGIVLIATAASLSAGTMIANKFILNPPTVSINSLALTDSIFYYSFDITNKANYECYYYIDVEGKNIVKEECTIEGHYEGSFSEFSDGQTCKFYIEFTNSIDYKKVFWMDRKTNSYC